MTEVTQDPFAKITGKKWDPETNHIGSIVLGKGANTLFDGTGSGMNHINHVTSKKNSVTTFTLMNLQNYEQPMNGMYNRYTPDINGLDATNNAGFYLLI